MPSVDFVVGNSYQKISRSRARLDRSGRHSKVHDWTLFLDVINSDGQSSTNSSPDIIERVTFDLGPSFSPTTFTCWTPIPIVDHRGRTKWRFKTRQQTYGSVNATIKIRGAGGTTLVTTHSILLGNTESEHLKGPVQQFVENRPMKPLKALKLNENQNFGIELELSSSNMITDRMIADMINNSSSRSSDSTYVEVIDQWGSSRQTSSNWKIVPDSSIMCTASSPDCNKFELVSPILRGGSGLSQVNKILNQLQSIEPKLKVNKSMGFHLHIDVESLSHGQLVKICQNFIKYEDVIDTLMPPSRRSGSEESNRYFQSNRQSVADQIASSYYSYNTPVTNRMCHDALEETDGDFNALIQLMNNSGRYYKLNLQNLSSGRQPTIEFRQHSATTNYEKVSTWVRFCVAFCVNSAKLAPPTPFASSRSLDYKFNALFQYVIKDRALRDYYTLRREELSHHGGVIENSCCTSCVSGGQCTAHIKRRRN